jgi:hypothetical protein
MGGGYTLTRPASAQKHGAAHKVPHLKEIPE